MADRLVTRHMDRTGQGRTRGRNRQRADGRRGMIGFHNASNSVFRVAKSITDRHDPPAGACSRV
ncbi:hypothetical protein SXCC_03692 [Gluconacetobacter sp. SXCC-1]|nr:hypothetical protein SXCC_03692 [Gluconacetobacter sp. SXCC-1]